MPTLPLLTSTPLATIDGIRLFVVVLVVHATLTILAIPFAYALSMSRFDSGADATMLEHAAKAALAVLSFPILFVFGQVRGSEKWFPGLLGYLPLLVNSVVWAAGICHVVHRLGSRRRAGTAADGNDA